jgi:hypothetical protein
VFDCESSIPARIYAKALGVDMFKFMINGSAHVLSWMFVIGMAGSVFMVIPVAAYQLFKVLFERDLPDETNPSVLLRRARKA